MHLHFQDEFKQFWKVAIKAVLPRRSVINMENAVSKGEQYSFDFMGRIFSDRSINKYKDRSFNRTTRIMYIDLLS